MTERDTARAAFLDAVAMGEDYDPADYDELVGGGRFTGFAGFPVWDGIEFAAGISHAAGRYQFEPATWRAQVKKLDLADFSPPNQDAAAWDLAVSDYHRRTGRVLLDDLLMLRLDGIGAALHATWTSMSDATFPVRYRAALAARQAPVPDTVSAPAPWSEAVRDLQRRLMAAGYYKGALDGRFGPLSYAALRAAQGGAA